MANFSSSNIIVKLIVMAGLIASYLNCGDVKIKKPSEIFQSEPPPKPQDPTPTPPVTPQETPTPPVPSIVPANVQQRACKDGHLVASPGTENTYVHPNDLFKQLGQVVYTIPEGGGSLCFPVAADTNFLNVDFHIAVGGMDGSTPFFDIYIFSKLHPEIAWKLSDPRLMVVGADQYYNLPAGEYVVDIAKKSNWDELLAGREPTLKWTSFFNITSVISNTDSNYVTLYNNRKNLEPSFFPTSPHPDWPLELEDFVKP